MRWQSVLEIKTMRAVLMSMLVTGLLGALGDSGAAALISGTIRSVNGEGKLVVTTTGDKAQSFVIPAGAVITLDGKNAKLNQLEAGQKVSVFTTGNNGAVTRVNARAAKAATPMPTPLAQPKPAAMPESPSATQSASGNLVWTQYGGPNRDNVSPERGLLARWPAGGPELKWTADNLGEGYSSVSMSEDGQLFTMGSRGDDELTICLDVNTGREIWSQRTGRTFREGQGNGPRGTPTIDGDRVYSLGGNGDLACLKRAQGDVVWQGNILSNYGGDNIVWGISESVLIDGNQAVFTPGGKTGTMVAVDKLTGKEIWRSMVPGSPQAAYSSIVPIDVGGVRQYVNFVHTAVVGIDARSGQTLWGNQSPANDTANCSSPIALGDYVFAASGYGTGGTLIQLAAIRGKVNAREVYHTNQMKNHHGGMVVVDGYLYGTDEKILTCIELRTGMIQWENRSVGKGAVVYADGHIILRGEEGPVAMFAASPNAYEEQGRFEPPRSNRPAWAHPVVANGCLFLREQDKLYCYQLK